LNRHTFFLVSPSSFHKKNSNSHFPNLSLYFLFICRQIFSILGIDPIEIIRERGLGVGGFSTSTQLITGSTLQRLVTYITEGEKTDIRDVPGRQSPSQYSALKAQRVASMLEREAEGYGRISLSSGKTSNKGKGTLSSPSHSNSPNQANTASTPGLGSSAHSVLEDSDEEEI